MNIVETQLPGVRLIEPDMFADDRGFFLESWSASSFSDHGMTGGFVQDNHSRSAKNVLRGLHFQADAPQGKLVRVTAGAVFDVVADIRPDSATFGQWTGHVLTAANRLMMWIPPGFAHGFLSLVENTDFLYKCTATYDPAGERSVAWDDPDLAIWWPLEGAGPRLSAKDAAAPSFASLRVPA